MAAASGVTCNMWHARGHYGTPTRGIGNAKPEEGRATRPEPADHAAQPPGAAFPLRVMIREGRVDRFGSFVLQFARFPPIGGSGGGERRTELLPERHRRRFDCMSLAELEKEVLKLSPGELSAFTRWLDEYASRLWDEQIERDVAAGRLDRLGRKADEDFYAGRWSEL